MYEDDVLFQNRCQTFRRVSKCALQLNDIIDMKNSAQINYFEFLKGVFAAVFITAGFEVFQQFFFYVIVFCRFIR